MERCRDIFERATRFAGYHYTLGSEIWELYRDFEESQCQPGELTEKFITLCKTQLSIPSANYNRTFELLRNKLSDNHIPTGACNAAMLDGKEADKWEADLVGIPFIIVVIVYLPSLRTQQTQN